MIDITLVGIYLYAPYRHGMQQKDYPVAKFFDRDFIPINIRGNRISQALALGRYLIIESMIKDDM